MLAPLWTNRILVVWTSPVKRGHILKEPGILAHIATSVSYANIVLSMRSVAFQGNDMIVVDFMMWKNIFFAYIAPFTIPFTDALVVNLLGVCMTFNSSNASHTSLKGFFRMNMSIVTVVCTVIFLILRFRSPDGVVLFPLGSFIVPAAILVFVLPSFRSFSKSFGAFKVALLELRSRLILLSILLILSRIFYFVISLFSILNSTCYTCISHAFKRIKRFFISTFDTELVPWLWNGIIRVFCSTPGSEVGVYAWSTVGKSPVSTFYGRGIFLKGLVYSACSAHFREDKQRQLRGLLLCDMIYFGHDINLQSRLDIQRSVSVDSTSGLVSYASSIPQTPLFFYKITPTFHQKGLGVYV